MKRILSVITFCLLFSGVHAQPLHAFMRSCSFLSVESETPYVETYLTVPGFELTYVKNENGKFEGALRITLIYYRDTAVYASDLYTLRTPELDDTADISFNVLDMRRKVLPQGEYTVHLEMQDINNPSRNAELNQGLKIHFEEEKICLSDIELVQHYQATTEPNLYSKSGYDIKPMAFSFYPTMLNKLTFYNEIYNADKVVPGEDIVIFYSIKQADKGAVAGDLLRFTKQKAAPVNILFSEFNIEDIPTGNYYVDIEIKNKKNELLAQQIAFFQRANKNSSTELNTIALINIKQTFVDAIPSDSMVYFLKSIFPLAELNERNHIMSATQLQDTQLMKQFFYNFWQKRNPDNPYMEWAEYNKAVRAVNYHYGTPVQYGFETDRGRVFLQYGKPNSMEGNSHESGAYPYEIWHYYKLNTNQSNIKFVFCNFDLVSNDYKLIHSEARGEIYDPRWRFKIYKTFKDGNGYSNLDEENFRDIFGSQVDEYFER